MYNVQAININQTYQFICYDHTYYHYLCKKKQWYVIHLDHLFSTHLPHRNTVTPLSTAELTSGWLKYPEERKVLVHGCPGPRWPIFGWKSLSANPLPCLRHRLDRTLPARAVGALLWRCLKLCDRRSRAIYMTCVKQQGSKHQKRLLILLLLLFSFNINKQTLSTLHIHHNYIQTTHKVWNVS